MTSTSPNTLPALIARAANGDGKVTFADPSGYDTIPWSTLHAEAKALAASLETHGVASGDHVAILGPTSRALVTAVQGVWLAGGCVVMLPLPMRLGSIETFVEQTRKRISDAEATLVLMDPQFAPFVTPEPSDPPFVLLDSFDLSDEMAARYVAPEIDPDQLAVLQFTSGSTSDPKGVMLPHRTVCANVIACAEAGGLVDDDVIVSWLPLYHDMGMIGMLTIPMCRGNSLVLGAPQDFLAKPLRWLQWISDFGGSVTAAPNFAYVLAMRALRKADDTLDLSRMKVLLNGAEPIDAATFERFLDRAGEFGLPRESAFPAFGMAEVCIGGAFSPRGRGLVFDTVDGEKLENEHVAVPVEPGAPGAKALALLGKPVPGLEMRIVSRDTGEVLPERQVGELQISGTSVTSGYYKNPEATAELLADGWLHTGDLAYMVDGDLVICGRIKDVIIIGGRNIYPQDIEWSVSAVPGVRPGNVIAFGIDGRAGAQQIVVVAEHADGEASDVVTGIAETVTREIGVPPMEVVMVAKGTIPKTSSGKLQRSACKAQWSNGALEAV